MITNAIVLPKICKFYSYMSCLMFLHNSDPFWKSILCYLLKPGKWQCKNYRMNFFCKAANP